MLTRPQDSIFAPTGAPSVVTIPEGILPPSYDEVFGKKGDATSPVPAKKDESSSLNTNSLLAPSDAPQSLNTESVADSPRFIVNREIVKEVLQKCRNPRTSLHVTAALMFFPNTVVEQIKRIFSGNEFVTITDNPKGQRTLLFCYIDEAYHEKQKLKDQAKIATRFRESEKDNPSEKKLTIEEFETLELIREARVTNCIVQVLKKGVPEFHDDINSVSIFNEGIVDDDYILRLSICISEFSIDHNLDFYRRILSEIFDRHLRISHDFPLFSNRGFPIIVRARPASVHQLNKSENLSNNVVDRAHSSYQQAVSVQLHKSDKNNVRDQKKSVPTVSFVGIQGGTINGPVTFNEYSGPGPQYISWNPSYSYYGPPPPNNSFTGTSALSLQNTNPRLNADVPTETRLSVSTTTDYWRFFRSVSALISAAIPRSVSLLTTGESNASTGAANAVGNASRSQQGTSRETSSKQLR